jgi:hypothetical protein
MLKVNVRCAPLKQHDNMVNALTVFKPASTATTAVRVHTTQFCGKTAVSCRALSIALLDLLIRLSVCPGYSGRG